MWSRSTRTGAIIQARLGSKRFPQKVTQTVGYETILGRILNTLRKCENLDSSILAVPEKDKEYFSHFEKQGFSVYYDDGDENDVLRRFYKVARRYKLRNIVRICADSPFILGWLIDWGIEQFKELKVDFLKTENFPKGQNIEIMSKTILDRAEAMTYHNTDYREHVTLFFDEHPEYFKVKTYKFDDFNMSVDTKDDLKFVQKVAKYYDKYI